MSIISNSEKQARFRKKEELKKYADKLFRDYSLLLHGKTIEEMRLFIDKTTDLPFGWTDDDYDHAVKSLNHFFLESYDNPHQLANDVQEGRNIIYEFKTTPDPAKFSSDIKDAIKKARSLSAHIMSALNLSGCPDSDKAAALLEVVRFLGHSIASNRKVPKSQATTMCLASIGPQYERPDWFAGNLANTLGWNLNKDLAREVGKHLKDFRHNNSSLDKESLN